MQYIWPNKDDKSTNLLELLLNQKYEQAKEYAKQVNEDYYNLIVKLIQKNENKETILKFLKENDFQNAKKYTQYKKQQNLTVICKQFEFIYNQIENLKTQKLELQKSNAQLLSLIQQQQIGSDDNNNDSLHFIVSVINEIDQGLFKAAYQSISNCEGSISKSLKSLCYKCYSLSTLYQKNKGEDKKVSLQFFTNLQNEYENTQKIIKLIQDNHKQKQESIKSENSGEFKPLQIEAQMRIRQTIYKQFNNYLTKNKQDIPIENLLQQLSKNFNNKEKYKTNKMTEIERIRIKQITSVIFTKQLLQIIIERFDKNEQISQAFQDSVISLNQQQYDQQNHQKYVTMIKKCAMLLQKIIKNLFQVQHQSQITVQPENSVCDVEQIKKYTLKQIIVDIQGLNDQNIEIDTIQDIKKLFNMNLKRKLQYIHKVFNAKFEETQVNQENLKNIQNRLQSLAKSMEMNQKQAISKKYKRIQDLLFCDGTMKNECSSKKFLIQSIQQSYDGSRIIKTTLLYKFDPLNQANFHKYINEYQNWLLIVRLQNGYLLAAFCEESLKSNMLNSESGILISLTNQKVFKLDKSKNHHKAVIYDPYYIIFGNSEIRIKTLENKMFSNFGIVNSFFGTSGHQLQDFIGQKMRQVVFTNCQIYQLTFEKN